jgi:hypothetical protein
VRRIKPTSVVIVVRFADEIVPGFQVPSYAERFWKELIERLRKFRLEPHPDKTRGQRAHVPISLSLSSLNLPIVFRAPSFET